MTCGYDMNGGRPRDQNTNFCTVSSGRLLIMAGVND